MFHPKVIGITGIFGSGKTTVSSILKKNKIPVISSDEIVHKIIETSKIKKLLVKKFGKEILTSENKIDRKKLAEIVFSNKKKKMDLEKIIHPLVFEQIKRKIFDFKKRGCKIISVEIPLLYETKSEKYFDKILVVYTHPDKIKERLKGKFTNKEIERRWKFQLPQKIKIKKADFVVDNSGSYLKTKNQVKNVINLLKNLRH